MKKSLVYLQSGGPTSVINSSLYGVVIEARKHQDRIDRVYGAHFGVEGLLNGDLIDLTDVPEEELELLKQTPGAALGSSRHKLGPGDKSNVLAFCESRNIGYILVNGGNDSMDTCHRLGRFFESRGSDIRVIGVPKTMDNDLVEIDHTPGFGSAAKQIINSVQSIIIDGMAYTKGKVVLIEVMGRETGWVAAVPDLLEEPFRPDLFYFPEIGFDYEECKEAIQKIYKEKKRCFVMVGEGIPFERKNSTKDDGFGHRPLDGVSPMLAERLSADTGLDIRWISLSIPTRCSPTLIAGNDQKEAIEVGKEAVKAALAGETWKMVSIRVDSRDPYKVSYPLVDAEKVANGVKPIPPEFLCDHTRMSDAFREYLRPLVAGQTEPIKEKDGIALSFKR